MDAFEAGVAAVARSRDGTQIAIFAARGREPAVATDAPPLLLVHGTTADHTTFRAVAPLLATRRTTYAMDRRGRGASGDSPGYAIEREFEDVAAAAELLAGRGGAIDVLGHSYGGRCALGASLTCPAIRRVVAYEGAPTPPGVSFGDEAWLAVVREAVVAGEHERALETFFRAVVGMDDELIARYRADPVWPVRVAAAPTIVREADAEAGAAAAGLDALGRVRVQVLQILGTLSPAPFRQGIEALHARLEHGRIAVIEGAAHAAHHTHPAEFTRIVEAFLDEGQASAVRYAPGIEGPLRTGRT